MQEKRRRRNKSILDKLTKHVPKMIGYGKVSEEQKMIIEAAIDPSFGKPGMSLKQKIKAATEIFNKLREKQNETDALRN